MPTPGRVSGSTLNKIAANSKNSNPFNKILSILKKQSLMIMLAAMPIFTSCDKDEPEDPIKAKIEALQKKEKEQATAVRAAVEPALTQPEDIQDGYWGVFDNANVPRGTNLNDSAIHHTEAIDDIRRVYGTPIPFNDETLSALYSKCQTYILTYEELQKLLQSQK
jgi:hypothetical protein